MNKKTNLRIIGIVEKETQVKRHRKIIEEYFSNTKEIPIKVQESYTIPSRLDQKRKSLQYIIIKALNIQNKEIVLKTAMEKD